MATRYASGATWNTASNWGTTSGASDGSVPTASDAVIFDANSVSMAIDVNATCLSINSTGFTATLTQNATRTLAVANTLTWAGGTFVGGTANISTKVFNMSAGTFTSTSANLTVPTNTGSFTLSGGTFNQTAGTVVFGNGGTGTMTLNITTGSFWNVLFNGSSSSTTNITGTIDVNGTTTFNDNYIIGGGTIAASGNVVSINSKLYVSGTILKFDGVNQSFSAGGGVGRVPCIEIASSGTLTINDTMLVANAVDATAWKYTSGAVSDASGTVQIGIPGNRTCTIDSGAQTFPNVRLNIGSAGNLTIVGTMDINGSLTFGSTIGYLWGGTIRVAGDVTCSQSVTTNSTCAIILDGGNSQSVNISGRITSALVTVDKTIGTVATLANSLSLSSTGQDLIITSGTLALAGYSLSVNDVFTIGANGTLNLLGTETITKGSLVNNKTVVYSGAGTAVLNKLGTSFTNLTFGASKTHHITAGTTITVTGVLDSNGTSATRSTLTSATSAVHYITLSGTSSLTDNMIISYSIASVEIIVLGSIDGGNNNNWIFCYRDKYQDVPRIKPRNWKENLLWPRER